MKTTIISKIIASFVLAVSLIACKDGNHQAATETLEEQSTTKNASDNYQVSFTKAQYELAKIATGSIVSRNLSSIVKLNGTVDVEPKSMATVSAPLGGYLKTAGLLPGQEVKKGQVLATIENPEFIKIQQEYLESLGTLEYLQEEYNRQKELREDDINSTKVFQKVASDYKITQAKVKGYEQQIALAGLNLEAVKKGEITRTAHLYAPIAGYIKTSHKNIGDYVTPQDVIFELINLEDVHLALNAFEKDLQHIKMGQTVKFSLASENKFDRTAKVFLVGKATDQDRITEVHCHIVEGTADLLPGMYVKAWVETEANEQTAVLVDALLQYDGKDFVIVEKSATENDIVFELQQVIKGDEQEGYVAISGSNVATLQNAKIVTQNAYAILSALKNATEGEE